MKVFTIFGRPMLGGHHSITRGGGGLEFLNWINIYFTSCRQYFIYFTLFLNQNIYFAFLVFILSVYKAGSQSFDVGVQETTEVKHFKLKCHLMMPNEARQQEF